MKIAENINIEIDSRNKVLWLFKGNNYQLHYSFEIINDFYNALNQISDLIKDNEIKTVIIKSANEKVWSMGGDLELFIKCSKNKDINMLKKYAYNCIRCIHTLSNNFNSDATIISFIQGNAFGGGFECALASDYIISENHVKFSFPESLFGTFPGMGAYSFLTRKIGYKNAEEIIHSTTKWSAKDMIRLNIIDWIIDPNSNEDLFNLIQEKFPPKDKLSKICNTPTLNELTNIVDEWLEMIMELDGKQINFIEKIISSQKNLASNL